jgi:anti-anti-sigma factor
VLRESGLKSKPAAALFTHGSISAEPWSASVDGSFINMVRGTIDSTKRRGSAMEFAHENAGDVAIAKLAGRLDSSSAPSAEEQLTRLIADSAPRLVIDLSKLEYISSAGLRVLLLVARKIQQSQGKLAFFGLTPGVRDVFSVSGFDTIFTVRNDAAAATAAVR